MKIPLDMHDHTPTPERFRAEVLSGLKKPQKELPSKYFYDERGSELFERICELEEYYLTRTEFAILQKHIESIAAFLGPNALLIEYGSGASLKTRIVLEHLRQPAAYIPVDISLEQLLKSSQRIADDFPSLDVVPVCADYTTVFELPSVTPPVSHRVVYFPGSTIGNFDPLPAKQFLERIAALCESGGILIIGIDLKKDPVLLHRAYNDQEGVTADFNRNLLIRINRELGADFDLARFQHYAFYNPGAGRVEMHLVSQMNQTIQLDGMPFSFTTGESIWTESSYKYSLDEFNELAATAGFHVEQIWMDERKWFAVICCRVR